MEVSPVDWVGCFRLSNPLAVENKVVCAEKIFVETLYIKSRIGFLYSGVVGPHFSLWISSPQVLHSLWISPNCG